MLHRKESERKFMTNSNYAMSYVDDFHWVAKHPSGVNVYLYFHAMYPFEPSRVNVSNLVHSKVSLYEGSMVLPDYCIIDRFWNM